jgi:hypothetical protein
VSKAEGITKTREVTMNTITKMPVMIALAVGIFGIHDTMAERDYDLKTVESVWGKVLSVEKITPAKRRGEWVQLMLQVENGTIAVQLGPAWYVDKQVPRIEANDAITVTGSRLNLDGTPTIVAADIAKGSELLRLRDDKGIPVWPRRNEGSSEQKPSSNSVAQPERAR